MSPSSFPSRTPAAEPAPIVAWKPLSELAAPEGEPSPYVRAAARVQRETQVAHEERAWRTGLIAGSGLLWFCLVGGALFFDVIF